MTAWLGQAKIGQTGSPIRPAILLIELNAVCLSPRCSAASICGDRRTEPMQEG